MNNDNLLKQIEKIFNPLKEGQERLEQRLVSQGQDIKVLKEDITGLKQNAGGLNRDMIGMKSDISLSRLDNKRILFDNKILKQQMNGLERDNRILKEDIKQVDMKIEIVNTNLKKSKDEIISCIQYLYENAGTQEEIDKLKHRVKSLEDKAGIHN
ncbi:hypothetical protein KJ980_05040 [Patescibacteria group bacterium]|nr:hypothetical protein [Patescibacteria group bacterium]MBU4098985.1 hypothetical protein [Patescibacteria group bacterium]